MAKVYNVKSKIVAGIRKVWRFSPLRREVIRLAKTEDGFYRCTKCRKKTDNVEVDHKNPAVDPETGWQGYDIFIERLFCDISNLDALCLKCHTKKTEKENKVRKAKKLVDKDKKKE